MGRPIGAPEVADFHAGIIIGGMHNLAVAEVNTNVRDATAVGIGEEDQVPRLELAAADVRATAEFAGHAAAHPDTGLVEHIVDEAATIEARGGGAAKQVAIAN